MMPTSQPRRRKSDAVPAPCACTQTDTLLQISTTMATIATQQAEQGKTIEHDSKALWGNGEDGLITKVSKLGDDMRAIKGTIEWFTKAVLTIVISLGVVDIIYLIATHPIKGVTTP